MTKTWRSPTGRPVAGSVAMRQIVPASESAKIALVPSAENAIAFGMVRPENSVRTSPRKNQ